MPLSIYQDASFKDVIFPSKQFNEDRYQRLLFRLSCIIQDYPTKYGLQDYTQVYYRGIFKQMACDNFTLSTLWILDYLYFNGEENVLVIS